MALKKYDKKFEYSYTYGVYPTIDLLNVKGVNVIKVVLNSKGQRNEGMHEIEKICKQRHIKVEYDTKAILIISAKENTYAIGVFKKFERKINPKANHVVLVNPTNTGNLGTIIRTMVGFGFKDLAIIRPGVDIFDPKVIRSAMGGSFHINFEYFDGFQGYLDKFGSHNLYPFVLKGKQELRNVKFNSPFSLVFGNESNGLHPDFIDIGNSVYISQSKDVDSLNLSVATAVALYEASR